MNWFEKDRAYNIAAAGSIDREFRGPSKGQIGLFKGSEGGIDCYFFSMFTYLTFLRKSIFPSAFFEDPSCTKCSK